MVIRWEQILAWRLKQLYLVENTDYTKVVKTTLGFQSQVQSASELALHLRSSNLSQKVFRKVLNEKHTLIRTWAMRGTLYMLLLKDLPLLVSARKAYKGRAWKERYFSYFGLSEKQYYKVMEAIPNVLGIEPLTREQLATKVAEHAKDPAILKSLLTSSWGSLWKPSALNGDLCLAPRVGQNATFINPKKLIKTWNEPEATQAIKTVLRRYLKVYAPATPQNFAIWWEMSISDAKRLFLDMENELLEVEVEVGSNKGFILKEDLETIQSSTKQGIVKLLPLFDVFTLSLPRKSELAPILPVHLHKKIFRPQGWVTPVVIVDGYIKGIWDHVIKGDSIVVTVEPFENINSNSKDNIVGEAKKISQYFGKELEILFK